MRRVTAVVEEHQWNVRVPAVGGADLLTNLFIFLGSEFLVVLEEKIAGAENAGTEQDQGKFPTHPGHILDPPQLCR